MTRPRLRLDVLLVERGLAASRERARALVIAGQVRIEGQPATKAGTLVRPDADVTLAVPDHPYVSRGGLKLAAALDAFEIEVSGRTALDIGASTGGPQALNRLVVQIDSVIQRAPVLITQHMPPTFTAVLAEHLARVSKFPVREASDGEEVSAGAIYLAPGGKHMKVERRDGKAVIAIDDGPMVNFCKPAVDPLFASAAQVWGNKVLALLLTGMGSDGLAGAKEIVAAGGHVIAQDEETSVVWGMPGQVTGAGLCSAVLPLPEIGGRITRLFAGERQ